MSSAKIILLFGVLALILVGFGAIVGYLVGNIFVIASLFFVLAIAMNVFSYYKSDYLAIKMTRTKLIERRDNPRFYDLVRKVSEKAEIPLPRVGIMPSQAPNAFATGRDEKHAVVVATDSILSLLNDDEMEAVLGHEISHITHRDVLVATVAATIATIISFIGNIILFSELYGGMNERNSNASILLLVSAILIPLGATFVQLGISRSRESDADVGSVKLVRKPDQLISSLKKISKPAMSTRSILGVQNPRPSNGVSSNATNAYSSLFIVNNLNAHSLLNLFSTHPSLEKRIATITATKKALGIE